MIRMKLTIAKMEEAQASIRAAKLRSRSAPLGRELRKARTGEGSENDDASGDRDGAAAAGNGFRGGMADLGSESLDMRMEDTSALILMRRGELVCIVRGVSRG